MDSAPRVFTGVSAAYGREQMRKQIANKEMHEEIFFHEDMFGTKVRTNKVGGRRNKVVCPGHCLFGVLQGEAPPCPLLQHPIAPRCNRPRSLNLPAHSSVSQIRWSLQRQLPARRAAGSMSVSVCSSQGVWHKRRRAKPQSLSHLFYAAVRSWRRGMVLATGCDITTSARSISGEE